MVNFGPLAPEIVSLVLGTPANFNAFVSRVGFVTAATSLNGSQPNFALCLAISLAGKLYIHFQQLLPHNRILPGTKFTLCPSLALSYIGSITAGHSSSGRQPNCGVEQRAPPVFDRAAITLGIGPHSIVLYFVLRNTVILCTPLWERIAHDHFKLLNYPDKITTFIK